MQLEDLRIYCKAMEIGERVWNIVGEWKYFEKDTIGKQLIRSTDSIAANISEGFGRYHYKDVNKFNYISRGSLQETKCWLIKAHNRGLISDESLSLLVSEIHGLSAGINQYIKSVEKLEEPRALYHKPSISSETPSLYSTLNSIYPILYFLITPLLCYSVT